MTIATMAKRNVLASQPRAFPTEVMAVKDMEQLQLPLWLPKYLGDAPASSQRLPQKLPVDQASLCISLYKLYI